MKLTRKALVLTLALLLALSCVMLTTARADTGVKAKNGAFAAMAQNSLFMILPTETGSSLYSMPMGGNALTLIETAPQINDLIAGPDGRIYYLRYTGAVFQVVVRGTDGARTALASFNAGQIAYSLSYYDGMLFCLVDNQLTRIDATGATGAQTVSTRKMGSYTIADGIVYYESKEDEATYQRDHTNASGQAVKVTTSAGRLYAMHLDGSDDMQQFDQGVSNLAVYDNYVYFHNYNDNYVVDGSPDAWLDGKLYRLNVQTNQYQLLRDSYDWNYRPVDMGLVIYQERALTLFTQDGANPVLLYDPDPYNYIALLDDCAIVYEYNLQKLTRVPYDQTGAVQLWNGPFVTTGTPGDVISATATPIPGGDTTGTTPTTAPNATVAPATGTNNGTLVYGSTGEEVRAMQKRLKELGYLKSADGIFGDRTLTAVKQFQRAAGLTVDGVAGKNTLSRLNRSDAPEYDGSSAATDSSYIFPNSSREKLTRSEIQSINSSLWSYARNEILARHGYTFTKSKYKNYFESKTWYKAGGYSSKDLNSIEWYNIDLIKEMEEEVGGNSSSSGSGSSSTSSDYIFPNSSTTKLTKSEIRNVDKSLWPYARNEIYARHGYKFTKSNFKKYFEGKSWYKAGGFSTKDLNDTEWYNMELIRWMEENEG